MFLCSVRTRANFSPARNCGRRRSRSGAPSARAHERAALAGLHVLELDDPPRLPVELDVHPVAELVGGNDLGHRRVSVARGKNPDATRATPALSATSSGHSTAAVGTKAQRIRNNSRATARSHTRSATLGAAKPLRIHLPGGPPTLPRRDRQLDGSRRNGGVTAASQGCDKAERKAQLRENRLFSNRGSEPLSRPRRAPSGTR